MKAPAHDHGQLEPHAFPPALVPVLRDRLRPQLGTLAQIDDEALVQLLTTVFFAGLETYEGERNPIGVIFVGASTAELVMPAGEDPGAIPVYRWKILHFVTPRPFVIPELVKLAVAEARGRIYSTVRVADGGRLEITGLAREGFNAGDDPFVKIVASRPGCLSIRRGRERLLEYDRGAILAGGQDVVAAAKRVRGALEATARAAGIDADGIARYLETVRALVAEMAAHGHGGILVISPEQDPSVAASAPYRMVRDSSLVALLRVSQRVGQKRLDSVDPSSESASFAYLLRTAFVTEAERVVEELGVLTGIDGATVLNRDLALVAFGVILPVRQHTALAEAAEREGLPPRAVDLGDRGTRHRAGATYAADHPGSVVFVASEDGRVTCMLRDETTDRVLLWRLGPSVT